MSQEKNSRDLAEDIDVMVGKFHLNVLEKGEEVISPTGEVIRKEPSAAMIGKMQQYVQMHGVAQKANSLATNIQESLRRQKAPPALKLTGTDGKNALASEVE